MFRTILVPADGSPPSLKAIRAAIELARAHQGRIVALAVAEAPPLPPDPDYDAGARLAEARLRAGHVVRAARDAGIAADAVVAVSARPHEEIARTAAELQCDLIVMVSHHRADLERTLAGSETGAVLRATSVPVLVLRP